MRYWLLLILFAQRDTIAAEEVSASSIAYQISLWNLYGILVKKKKEERKNKLTFVEAAGINGSASWELHVIEVKGQGSNMCFIPSNSEPLGD